MTKLRILVLSMVFPPDGVSTAQLVGEIVEDLGLLGHDVTVVTTQPHYNLDSIARSEQPLHWHWSRLFAHSEFRGTNVLHMRMGAKSPRRMGRLLQWSWFHVASFCATLRRSSDVCLVVSPPPTLAAQSAIRRSLGGPPFVYAVWEAYPDILFAMGIMKPDSMPGRAARWLERWTYRKAERVTFLSNDMLDAATAREPQLNATGSMIATFVDSETFAPAHRDTALRSDLGIRDDQFVLGYAGNLGPAQDLSVVIDAARQLADRKELVVLICGAGSDEQRLRTMADGLANVIFAGHLPFARMPEVYATFDVSIVALAAGLSSEALPSKVYRSMACGCPLLAITNPASALAELVRSTSCGVVAKPTTDAVLQAVETLTACASANAQRGQAGRAAVLASVARPVVMKQIEQVLRDATESATAAST